MARETSVKVQSERNPSSRDPEKRVQPFFSVLIAALIVPPVFGTILRFIIFCAPESMWLVGLLDLLFFGLGGVAVAIGVGIKVAKRITFVVAHVATTVLLFAVAEYVTATIGWPPVDAVWYVRLLAVVKCPTWWVILYMFGSLTMALSWLLYRIDAFRAATGADEKDASGLRELLHWPKGAKIRVDTIEADEFAITAEIDHDGIPVAQLQTAAKSLAEHPGFVRGQATVIPGESGGRSQIRLVHKDPFASSSEWRTWPGLSHPGGLFHEPIRTSYFATGEAQWYSFVRTPKGYRSKLAPNFAATNGSFKGSQGATGSGKSGDAAIEQAEVFSRRDAQVIYIDPAKFGQNAGWCFDFCSLAAGSPAASGALFAGLRKLGEYRAQALGAAGVRDFDHEAFKKTGMSWIYIFADEFDVAQQGANMNWLATKGRSVGFRFAFTLPRATGENMDTNIRAAVGMWAQFGITQDYDKGFVLSNETIEAGANPESLGVTTPGAHYLDRASGISPSMWPIMCRSYRTEEDYSDLRNAVLAARSQFTPATWTAEERKILGSVLDTCSPDRQRTAGAVPPPDDPQIDVALSDPPAPYMPPAPSTAAGETTDKETPMGRLGKLFDASDLQLDPATRAALDDLPSTDTSQFGDIDPREPVVQLPPSPNGDDDALPDVKPQAPTKADAIADMERALLQLDRENVTEFGGGDVQARMKYAWSASSLSKRFSALAEDETLNPPGLKLERIGLRGRFTLIRVAGDGA